jgi:hypothetical protein
LKNEEIKTKQKKIIENGVKREVNKHRKMGGRQIWL